MRKKFIECSLKAIKNKYPNYSEERLDEFRYGLEGLYLLITKSIIIFGIAYFLGILGELIVFTVIYNIIRATSFGIHATKSWICLVSSLTIFIGLTYLSTIVSIPIGTRVIVGIIGIFYINKYSPADTKKRPIVSPKRRMVYKTISTIIACVFVVISVITTNDFIANCLLFSLVTQCVMISPLTYKLSGQPFDNYKTYVLDAS